MSRYLESGAPRALEDGTLRLLEGVEFLQSVVATTTGDNSVTVTWNAHPAAAAYDIERNGSIVKMDHLASPFLDTGLTPTTSYTYRVRAVKGWTPLNLVGLEAWFDSSDLTTITQSGGLVTQLSDKSGKGNHVTGSGPGRPTTGAVSLNGRNTLSFNGATSLIRLPIPLSVTDFFLYAVARTSPTSAARVYFSTGSNNHVALTHYGGGNGKYGWLFGGISWQDSHDTPRDVWYRQRVSRAEGTTTGYKNGTATHTTTITPSLPTGNFWIGGDPGGPLQTFDFAEAVVCNVDQSPADAAALEAYMAEKWGF